MSRTLGGRGRHHSRIHPQTTAALLRQGAAPSRPGPMHRRRVGIVHHHQRHIDSAKAPMRPGTGCSCAGNVSRFDQRHAQGTQGQNTPSMLDTLKLPISRVCSATDSAPSRQIKRRPRLPYATLLARRRAPAMAPTVRQTSIGRAPARACAASALASSMLITACASPASQTARLGLPSRPWCRGSPDGPG